MSIRYVGVVVIIGIVNLIALHSAENQNDLKLAVEEDKTVKLTIFLKESERKAFKVLCAEDDINMSAQVVVWIAEANAQRKRQQNK